MLWMRHQTQRVIRGATKWFVEQKITKLSTLEGLELGDLVGLEEELGTFELVPHLGMLEDGLLELRDVREHLALVPVGAEAALVDEPLERRLVDPPPLVGRGGGPGSSRCPSPAACFVFVWNSYSLRDRTPAKMIIN